MLCIAGVEEDGAVVIGVSVRNRSAGARIQIADHLRSKSRAVCLPRFITVYPIIGGKIDDAVQLERVEEERIPSQIDVLEQVRSLFGSIADPQLLSHLP